MTQDLLLGLDLGTTRVKALLLDRTGTEVATAEAPTPFVTDGARIEMAPASLIGAVGALVAGLPGGPAIASRIAGVGIDGMAECGAPLDARGTPLASVIAWHDPRGAEIAERLEGRFGEGVGLRTGQRPRSVSTIAKLGWLIDHGLHGVAAWLGVPELCLRDLTGAEATEHSLASRTGCYDVLEHCWLPDVAAAAGFSTRLFAPVLPAGSAMGRVTAEAATRWGLPPGIPVTLAGHDHLAGAVGAGAQDGDLVNSVGTAETVVGFTPAPPDLHQALALRTPVSVAPGGRAWVILAGATRAGVALGAVAERLGGSFAQLDALAEAAVPADASGLLAQALSGGPLRLPDATPGAIWHGLLGAMTARTADAAGRVAAQIPARRMLVIGGGAVSAPWMRLKREAIDLPLLRPRTAHAAARGAAVFAGVAAGWWPSAGSAPPPAMDPAVGREEAAAGTPDAGA